MLQFRRFFLLFFLALPTAQSQTNDWWNSNWDYRVSVSVDTGMYPRTEKPVEVAVNFTDFLISQGETGAFDVNSLRVVEVDASGVLINSNDPEVPYQFDPDPAFDATTNAAGTVVFLLDGTTPSNTVRYFHFYIDVIGGISPPPEAPTFADKVIITDDVMDEGQNSIRVETFDNLGALVGTYYYQKQGGGFSSLVDRNGNDWIDYNLNNPLGGAAGDFRGIPNLVFPEGHFHPGALTSVTSLSYDGPLKATIRSKTSDNLWEVTWEIYPNYAKLSVLKTDGNYWFLYEGTPGGLLNVNSDYLVRSDGTQTFLSESWTQDLTGDEWVYFSDPLVGISGRSLFLANHQDDAAIDSYRQLDNAMTVFGFGRSGTTSLLDQIPGYFTIGLIDDTSFNSASSTIFSAYKDLNVVIENIPPVIRSVTSGDPNLINVLFSKELESTTAEDALNYAISDGVTVSSATLNADSQTVVLDTSEMVEGVTYTVTVNNIEDIIGNVIAPNSQATFEFSNQDPDLILDYLLEEGSGTVATDSSGQGNDGALINGPTFTSETVNGSAYSLSFDGTDDYIDAGIFDVNGSGLTLAAWFKADSFPGSSNDPRIISKASGTSANDHVFMLGTVKSSGTVRLRARMRVGGSTTTLIADSGDLATDTWYHAAVTYDGATLRLYLNGTEVRSTALTGPVDNDPTLAVTIGAQPAGSKYFDGLLDDVRILQRGLDVNEIAALIGVNQAPVSFDENYSVTEDTSLSITAPGILANDSDPDGNALTAALETGVSSGALTLNPDGSFTYTPSANFSGTDSFTYQASDGSLLSNASTVTISVSPVNDAPVVINDSYQASPGELLMVDSASGVLANDNDIDLDTLSVVLISDVSNGVLALSADGSFDYTPNTGFGGEDSFTYQASDGEFTAQATVTLLVVVPPTAADDVYNTDEDTTLTVTGASILDNDTSPDGNLLQAALVGDVSNGTLTLNTDGTFDYSPAVDFSGEDSFTYNAVDGITGATASATVTITVNPVNDAPVGVDDSYQLEQDGQITVNAPGVLDNDSDIDGNPLTASLSASVSNGALTLNPDGSFDYTPNAGFLGTDSFTYFVNDGQQDSTEATVSLLVSAADQDNLLEFSLNEGSGMIATDSSGQGNDGALINGPIFTSETVNGSAYSLSFDGVDDYIDAGTLDVSGSGLTLAAWFKADSFPGSSNDPRIISKASGTSANDHVFMLGTTKSSGTVRLRARVRVGGSTTTLIASSGDLATDSWYHAVVTYDGATLRLYLDGTEVGSTALTGPVDNDPTLAVTIGAQPAGSKYFDGLLDDVRILQRGLDVNEIAALIGVNQAPVSFDENYSVTEDTSLSITAPGILANDSDPDGNALTAALETGVSSGALTLNADGSFTYTPSANFSGTDGFTYQASDGSLLSNASTVTISVSPVNDAPVLINDSYQASPGELLMIDSASGVLANDNDIDLDTLSVVLISDVSNGVLALSADGSFDYTPNTGFGGEDSFTYQASDGEFTAQATVTLLVVVPPTAADDVYNTDEDTTLTVTGASILDNDTSPDGNLLQAALVGDVSNGTLTLNTDGTFDYSPAVDFSGEDSFTYNAVDGITGATASATVTITVTPVNDAPVGVDDSYQLEQDGQITVNAPGVLDNDSDIDGNPLTASLSASVSNGALTLNPDGSFDYTPNAGFLGTDSFTYVVNDGQQDSAEATVSLLVSAADQDNLLEFSLNEGSGMIATDSSGQGNDGALINGPTFTSETVNGSAYSLSFDGVDDYVDAGIFDVSGSGLTLAAWFKADSFPGSSNDPRIISKASGTSANDHVFMLGTTKSSGTVRLRARVRVGGSTTTLIASSGDLATDTWYHAAVTYDGATLSLYLDGTEVGSTALTGPVDNDPTLAVTIGAQPAGSKYFDGLLDDVRILQRGLDVNEIAALIGVNQAPVSFDENYSVTEDTSLSITAPGILANDSDPDGNALTAALETGVSSGALTLNADGSFTYTPSANFSGTDGFTYQASDGSLLSNASTVTISVSPVNDAPVVINDSYQASPGELLMVDSASGVLANDNDIDLDTLSVVLISDVSNGVLALSADGSFDYTPNTGFGGEDSFTYQASDGEFFAQATVTLLVVNPPVAEDDTYTVDEDTPLTIAPPGVLENDSNPEGNPLQANLSSDVSNGTLTFNSDDGSFDYTPSAHFNGTDSFTYEAIDTVTGATTLAMVTIEVNPVNDAPIGVDDSYQLEQDVPLTVAAPGVLDNDSDIDGNSLTAELIGDASNGILAFNPDGSFTYTPGTGFIDMDSFSYRVYDGLAESNLVTVTILPVPEEVDDIVHLQLNEGSGNIAVDISGESNDGILVGNPVFEMPSVEGAYALSLDGVDDYIDLGGLDVIGSGLTLAAFFKADNYPGASNDPRLISKASGTAGKDHIFMLGTVESDDEVRLRGRLRVGRSTTTLVADSGNLVRDVWYHAALTFDGSFLRLFLNGIEVGSTSLTGTVDTDPSINVAIGAQPPGAGGRFFDGLLDDVRILQRALTPLEIMTIVESVNFPASVTYSAVPSSGTAPLMVIFDASESSDPDGQIVSYEWDFGNGETDTGITTSHQFEIAGDYQVTLTVTDNEGGQVQLMQTIRVAQSGEFGNPIIWSRLSSNTGGEIPPPNGTHPQQTVALVFDVDGDDINDFVIGSRFGDIGPSIEWWQYTNDGWIQHLIEPDLINLEAGGAYHDIDGDGDIDFVIGEGTGGNPKLYWWENPSPDFSNRWTRREIKNSPGIQHHDQLFGDFDGDGLIELAYWVNRSRSLRLADLPSDPTVEPWPAVEIFSPSEISEGLASADINGDGVTDLVGGGYWFEYDGSGGYIPQLIDPEMAFTRVATAQFITGGRPEIVFDSGDVDGGSLLLYSWDGTDWVSQELISGPSNYGHSLNVGDINGDGNMDIMAAEMLIGNNISPKTRIFYGNGAGTFSMEIIEEGTGNHESKLADLDGDGDLDILGKPFLQDVPRVNIWLNEGPLLPLDRWERHVIDASVPHRTVFVEHGDMDGDGFEDVITGAWWWKNPGTADGVWIRNAIGTGLNQMAKVYDFDLDGDLDVIGSDAIGSSPSNTFYWAMNDGLGNFTIYNNIDSAPVSNFLQGVTVAEFTNGIIETVFSWQQGNGGLWALTVPSSGSETTQNWTWRQISTVGSGEGLDYGDIDNDGDLDFVDGISWFRNEGGGAFTRFELTGPTAGEPDRNILVDMDNDGDLDVVIGFGHDTFGIASWYEQGVDPTVSWLEHQIDELSPALAQSVDVADLNGDGINEVVIGEHSSPLLPNMELKVYEMQDNGTWIPNIVYIGDEHHDGAQLFDVDNDGDLDVVSIGWFHRRLTIYENLAN